jgi:hypothetical protein
LGCALAFGFGVACAGPPILVRLSLKEDDHSELLFGVLDTETAQELAIFDLKARQSRTIKHGRVVREHIPSTIDRSSAHHLRRTRRAASSHVPHSEAALLESSSRSNRPEECAEDSANEHEHREPNGGRPL